ncbi:MAG: chorismate lyase [Burkholderiales bacterium]|nr:chorismate lyase [Burkholderiales bacterium]
MHDSEWKRAAPHPDSPYRTWLLDRGSLTQRIQSRCAAFSVRGLRQRLARPCRDEVRELDLPARELALTREVFLYCKATPVVFAHTVLQRTALRGPWHLLATQGSKPLGATLFSNPKVARLPLHFKRLTARHELFQRAQRMLKAPPDCLWARRSLFIVERAPLMVTEVFLPGILELPA